MAKNIIEKHFDQVAEDYDKYKKNNSFYYDNLKVLLANLIPKNKKVLEIGCGTGSLLASIKPKYGYGFDISSDMIKIAKEKYRNNKNLRFSTVLPNKDDIFTSREGKYKYIFMSDVIEHLQEPEKTFKKIESLMSTKSIFINTMANPIWEPMLMLWEKLGWKMPEGPHKRMEYKEIKVLIEKSGMKIVKHDYKLLIPIKIPLITDFTNNYLEKHFKKLAFIEYLVAVRS